MCGYYESNKHDTAGQGDMEREMAKERRKVDCKWKTKPTGPGKIQHPITHFYGPKHADISVFITGVSVTATQPF